ETAGWAVDTHVRRDGGGGQRSWLYRRMVRGANTATSRVLQPRTQSRSVPAPVPCIRPRAAEVRCVIGLMSTNACTHPGMVDGSTKTWLANINGNNPVMITRRAATVVCILRPMAVQTHERQNENTSSSATASTTPM